jgi:hypothetical protein
MTETKSAPKAKADARDTARAKLADLAVEQGKLLDEQYAAKVAALDAHLAQVNEPFVGSSLTIKGNQGR